MEDQKTLKYKKVLINVLQLSDLLAFLYLNDHKITIK